MSDAEGWYAFAGLPHGTYRVAYDATSWSTLRREWVPSTTGTAWPVVPVRLAGTALAHFGWRPIRWSTDLATPLETFVAPDGMRIQTYNDAVPAAAISAAVHAGAVGVEARTVTIRFAYGTVSGTVTSVVMREGRYEDFSATTYVSYDAWLDTPAYTLGHEYGHAWSWYHAYIDRQDPTMAEYLAARGLAGDPRVGSSYAWGVGEMIAEDYRQLLGPPEGRPYPQANRDIPPAADVPGLEAYLASTFTRPAG